MGLANPPVMIYGDDVSHVVTEEDIANLLLCRDPGEREQAIRGVAGDTSVGLGRDKAIVENLRDRGVVTRPVDLGIAPQQATEYLLAARSIRDPVLASSNLYSPLASFATGSASVFNAKSALVRIGPPG